MPHSPHHSASQGPSVQYAEGPMGSGKTHWLINHAMALLENGHSSDTLLILCSNHNRQEQTSTQLLQRLQLQSPQFALGDIPCMTFSGVVRKTLNLFWPLVEKQLISQSGKAVIQPLLTGFEETEQLLAHILHRHQNYALAKGQIPFQDFSGSESALISQLIRRLRLRSENRLSRQAMIERSRWLNHPCIEDLEAVEKALDSVSLGIRLFDPARQQDVFHALIEKEPEVKAYFQTTVQHLLVDDMDETTPSQQAFIRWLIPQVQSLRMACDPDGGSRRGYLNAYPQGWSSLTQLRTGETIVLERHDPIYQTAQALLASWTEKPLSEDMNAQLVSQVIRNGGVHPTRLEQWDAAIQWVIESLEAGGQAGEMAIAIPKHDILATEYLIQQLRQRGIGAQTVTGTQRPIDDPLVRCFSHLLHQLYARKWQIPLTLQAIQTLLTQLLRLDITDPDKVIPWATAIAHYEDTTSKNAPLWPEWDCLPQSESASPQTKKRYQQLVQALNNWQNKPFKHQLYGIFQNAISPFIVTLQAATELTRLINGAEVFTTSQQRVHELFDKECPPEDRLVQKWLTGVQTGIMANTPSTARQVEPHSVVIGTPQSLIDYSVKRRCMAWLDISSREWTRSDDAPLYNAWVHSPAGDFMDSSEKPSAENLLSESESRRLIRLRAGHLTRTLMLLSSHEITVFDSLRDDLNREQAGDLAWCLQSLRLGIDVEFSSAEALAQYPPLRADQANVLKYSSGTLAISAVPGAGKTFVNVALILKLVDDGVDPTKILVLTYMESAARTLLARLQKSLGTHCPLPSVSTIHGLAYRILTENDRYKRFPELGEELTLLDEYEQTQLLEWAAKQSVPHPFNQNEKRFQQWLRLCSRLINEAKSYRISPEQWQQALSKKPPLKKFITTEEQSNQSKQSDWLSSAYSVYQAYQAECRQKGLIDFTDLIGYTITLLEHTPNVTETLRKRYQIILEDEAQDSSHLLQQLLSLLGGEHPNLIRTGDTNQSITTSFTAADPSVFRSFIQQAQQTVTMNYSARCCPEILLLANDWVKWCLSQPTLSNAFQPVFIEPVPATNDQNLKNPSLLLPIEAVQLASEKEEKQWLVERIRNIKTQHPEASIAVLMATNDEVLQVTQLLQEGGIPAVCLSDQLQNQPIFQALLYTLEILQDPSETIHQINLIHTLHDLYASPLKNIDDGWIESKESLQAVEGYIKEHSLWKTECCPFPSLQSLAYDLKELQQMALTTSVPHVLQIATQRWFNTASDRSNGWLCAIEAQRFLSMNPTTQPLLQVIDYFKKLTQARRFRQPFGESYDSLHSHVVQVMTLHKSKGQEFDVVFLPGLNQIDYEQEKKKDDRTYQLLYAFHTVLNTGFGKTPNEQLQLKQEERARLLYVGITRAKRGLIASCSQETVLFGRSEKRYPAKVFKLIASASHPNKTLHTGEIHAL
ncbi:MAG: ATP-dependent helicase [Vampirovibrionales bacterium]